MWPQLLLLGLYALSLGINCAQHGRERQGTHNVWIAIASLVVVNIPLYFGGFWNPLFGG